MDIRGVGPVVTGGDSRVELADLLSALELMPVATLVVSGDGRAIAVNQAWRELTGLGDQESGGQGWAQVLEMTDRHQFIGALGDLAASGGAASAERQLRVDGRSRRTRWLWRSRDLGGTKVAIVTVIDIEGDRPGPRTDPSGIGALTDQVGWVAGRIGELAATQTTNAAALLDATHNLYRVLVTLTPDSGGW